MAPLIALEFASGNGEQERDQTPLSLSDEGEVTKPGKFWVYEQIIRIPFYGIYEINNSSLEVYHLIEGVYQKMTPNKRGHYSIAPLGVELGLWQGSYQNQTQLWLRWWDKQGNLLLIGDERAELERLRAEQERSRAEQAESLLEQERQRVEQESQRAQEALARAARLAERLRAAGIEPDAEESD